MIKQMLNSLSAVDVRLRAMSHPGRRAMVRHALAHERSSSVLADIARLSRPAATQHLGILLEAGLLTVRTEGRHRWYRARPAALESIRAELAGFWEPRLQALQEAAER